MKKVVLPFLGTVLLCACNNSPDFLYENEQEVISWEYEDAPLIDKELKLIDSLEKRGFKINIRRGFIGRKEEDKTTYSIFFKSNQIVVNENNKDSLNYIREGVVNKLYCQIIPDSVIYAIDKIDARFDDMKYEKGVSSTSFFYKTYTKDTLEMINKFKVIRVGKDKYQREYLK